MRVATFLIFSLFFLTLNAQTDALNKKLVEITDKFLEDGVFSAASISIWKGGKQELSLSRGVVNDTVKTKNKVTEKTLFDLASLTKPIVAGSLFYHLEKEGKLDGKWKVTKFFPQIKQEFTLDDLLTHNTCLPAWLDLCSIKKCKSLDKRKDAVIEYIAGANCDSESRYSDINYIVLGFILEKITGKMLDKAFEDFLKKEFGEKTSLKFSPLKNGVKKSRIAATSYNYQKKRTIQGVVEDRNCEYLGGITGNAGLFGTAEDVSKFYSQMLKKDWYRKQIVAQRGFDKKEGEDSNYGVFADPKCSGHLGWTGTAFLICPQNNLVITILTNRTHSAKYQPADLNQIKLFRQAVFDAILDQIKN